MNIPRDAGASLLLDLSILDTNEGSVPLRREFAHNPRLEAATVAGIGHFKPLNVPRTRQGAPEVESRAREDMAM